MPTRGPNVLGAFWGSQLIMSFIPMGQMPANAIPTTNLEKITKVKGISPNMMKALNVAPKKQQSITIRYGLNLSANPVIVNNNVPIMKPNCTEFVKLPRSLTDRDHIPSICFSTPFVLNHKEVPNIWAMTISTIGLFIDRKTGISKLYSFSHSLFSSNFHKFLFVW